MYSNDVFFYFSLWTIWQTKLGPPGPEEIYLNHKTSGAF